MKQRMTAIATVVAAVGCLAACGLIWRMLDESRQQHRELMAQLAEMNSGGHSTTEAVEKSGQGADNSDASWRPMKVKLVSETGAPVQGDVFVSGTVIAGGAFRERLTTDAQRTTDFGPLPPGVYKAEYLLTEPNVFFSQEFLLGPGRPHEFKVICPDKPPGEFQLEFEIQPPETLAQVPLYYFANVNYQGQKFRDETWRINGSLSDGLFVLDAKGKVLGQASYDSLTVTEPSGSGYSISFVETLPPEFELQSVEALRAYELNVYLWPLVSTATDSASNEARPPLKRLTGAMLCEPKQQPMAGERNTIKVGPDHKEFWDEITEDLRRIEDYKTLPKISSIDEAR